MKKLATTLTLVLLITHVFSQQTSTNGNYYTGGSTTNLTLNTGTSSSPTIRARIHASNGFLSIGLGSTAPSQMLHVGGNTQTNGNLIFGSTASTGLLHLNSTTNNFSLRLNTTTRLTVLNSNGFVGINTVSPGYNLDVNGTINATAIRIGGTLLSTTPQWAISGSNISYSTGNVGIGTSSVPTGYRLAVAGKLITEEVDVKLQGTWPDYVFEEDYTLMPLAEVERFIKTNKHLPGVPSAKQVEADGISLGEMNATLLKKIEELTLYMIELKKENEAQQKLIESLLKDTR